MMAKILVIDDETCIRKSLRNLFETNGHEVMDAGDGKEGMKLYKEFGPDLIVTDIIMPEKEGLETIREIRKKDAGIKIIVISGGGFVNPETYLQLAGKLGANHTLTKPVNPDELLLTVKNLLAC
jgi:YesN/AraC family two-component response regulator